VCKRRLRDFSLSLSFAVLLFCSAATSAWPQDANAPTPSLQSTPPQPPLPMPSLPGFADNWQILRQLVSDWGTDSDLLLTELQRSQAIAEGLTRSLTESEARLSKLESLRTEEREAARKELESALRDAQAARQGVRLWRGAAIIAGCVAASLGAVAALK